MTPSGREYLFAGDGRVGVEPVDKGHAGRELHRRNRLRRQPVEHHDQRAQTVAMRGDQDALAVKHGWEDVLAIIGESARDRILQAFTAGRVDVVTASPNVDLLLAPFLARIVLVEPGEIAIVAFVEGLVPLFRQAGLPHFRKRYVKRVLGADEG